MTFSDALTKVKNGWEAIPLELRKFIMVFAAGMIADEILRRML